MQENTTMSKKTRDTSSLSLNTIMQSQDTMSKTTQSVQRQITLTTGMNHGMSNQDTMTIIEDRIDISTPMSQEMPLDCTLSMTQMMRFTMERKAGETVIRDS